MNLFLRLIWVAMRAWRAPRLEVMETSVVPLRVLPNDLDLNLHMNNARYLALMDLGRLDLTMRLGLLRAMVRQHWQPVLATAAIRFFRPLKVFERFELHTRVLWWDDRSVHMEQVFRDQRGVIARAQVRGVLVGREGVVGTQDILEQVGWSAEKPDAEEWQPHWHALEQQLKKGVG